MKGVRTITVDECYH